MARFDIYVDPAPDGGYTATVLQLPEALREAFQLADLYNPEVVSGTKRGSLQGARDFSPDCRNAAGRPASRSATKAFPAIANTVLQQVRAKIGLQHMSGPPIGCLLGEFLHLFTSQKPHVFTRKVHWSANFPLPPPGFGFSFVFT